jgi:hypothetical protein
MQNVHWTDPDWKTTRGLGFSVSKGSNGEKIVGHEGSCPGYRSSLSIIPASKMAYAVMINASGTNPTKYANGMDEILKKAKSADEQKPAGDKEPGPDLNEYAGYYNLLPWGSEMHVSAWYGKLVTIGLPTNSPAEAMTLFKHTAGDTFRRIRDDGELGEELEFERNDVGEIVRFKTHGNDYNKLMR